jgi:hypothetical protein
MTWTYNLTTIATSSMTQVRRLIGDVIATDQQIADEEINFSLTQRSSIYGAAADACRYIAAQYSRKADVIVQSPQGGALKTNYSQQAKSYLAMAAQFENASVSRGGALPYAGGIGVTDKQNAEADTDRVAPQYNIGMEDNYLPEGIVGNEVPSDAPTGGRGGNND